VFVEPAFYQRILAARDARQVTRALLIGILLWAAYDWGATLIGMAARAAVEQGRLPAGLEGRQALVAVCLTTLPVGLKGFFISGVLAAAMSSVDSYALLASGNLFYDIARPIFRPNWDERTLTRLTRLGIVLILVPSVLLALYFERISDAWLFMASILTSVAFVPAVAALLWRPRREAGLAGSLAGLGALAVFYLVIHGLGEPFAEEETYIFRFGGVEIWREYAVLFALPVSGLGFLAGQAWGARRGVADA
jgi:Na+/proline symporter